MSVFKRKTSAGKTKEYHYKFMQGGKTYHGVCENCFEKEQAIDFEKTKIATAKNLSVQKSVKALVENFKDELRGGDNIPLKAAYDLSLLKPHRRASSEKQQAGKRSYWRDFTAYLEEKHPDVIHLSDVTKSHAEEYVQYFRTKGRFNKKTIFKNHLKGNHKSSYIRTETKLAAFTVNISLITLNEVFNLLKRDAGLMENPFSEIHKVKNDTESREAFADQELKLIFKSCDPFIKRIFMTGLFTALREGDICTLKKAEIDFDNHIIKRKLLKTGKLVEIPIMAPFEKFLKAEIANSGDSEYVFPELAEMYLVNQSGISYRVKNFLESLGIKTTKKVAGRDREISVKDVHSCRHTFCYLAGLAGIPLVIVQSIVGHMTPQMTEHYSAHATREAKQNNMLLFPDFMKQDIIDVDATEPESIFDRISKAIALIQDSKMNATLKNKLLELLQ